jgi:cobalt/nickel transport system permease protein
MFIPILAMHIPDGFLDLPISLIGWLLSGVLIALALRQTRDHLGERQIPLMGVLAAFVFAAQMINFPVAGGTSGHLLGATLVAILLGPWAAVLVMTSVVAVQALLFQDGGLIVLGFNIFNMGVIGSFVGYAVYNWVNKTLKDVSQRQLIGAAAAAWVAVELAALATSLELAISGSSPLDIALPAMVGIHALIGIGEALITVGALAFIRQTRPDLMDTQREAAPAGGSGWIATGLIIALVVVLISPLANPNPDGLERVAEDKGFIDLAEEAPYEIMPDYTVSFIDNEALTTIAAGVIGTLIVAGVGFGLARVNRRKQVQQASGD